MTAGAGRTVAYTSFDQPTTITRGASTLTFKYDSELGRVKQVSPQETTLYFNDAISGVNVEKVSGPGGSWKWRNHIFAGGEMIALLTQAPGSTDLLRYFHKDHLGSTSAVTDANGQVTERLAYDVWGKRRFPNGTDDPNETIVAASTNRGFTNHEHLKEVGLIHMNGRVYDPQIGRFMRADPFIQSALSSQALNRYSYVSNNPLNTTDPTGYWGLKSIVKTFIRGGLFGALAFIPAVGNALDKFVAQNKFAQMAVMLSSIACLPAAPACAAANAAYIAAVQGGSLGDMFKAAVIAGVSSYASGGLGLSEIGQIAVQAAIGCGAALATGGNCARGAITSAISTGAGIALNSGSMSFAPQLVARAVVGGTVSAIGGGKFANGAVSAAFQYAAVEGIKFAAQTIANAHLSSQARSKIVVNGNDEEKAAFAEARRYLSTTATGAAFFKKADQDGLIVNIDYNLETTDSAKIGGRVINWAPNLRGVPQGESAQTISPALILLHEMVHAFADEFVAGLQYETKDEWDTLDEWRVIRLYENPVAAELGEGIRNSHRGQLEPVSCVTCR